MHEISTIGRMPCIRDAPSTLVYTRLQYTPMRTEIHFSAELCHFS
jgi:hypothetical protein